MQKYQAGLESNSAEKTEMSVHGGVIILERWWSSLHREFSKWKKNHIPHMQNNPSAAM